jgi:hypothetical protein
MATAEDAERIASSLPGAASAPHVDRTAFKVARIFATPAPDRATLNLKFTPDEQRLKCTVAPDAFAPVPGGWGRMGWTTATLAALSEAELRAALDMAWRHAQPTRRPRRRR